MPLIIVTFLLYCGVCFLLHFCYDAAEFWESKNDEPRLYMPKLTDLGGDVSVREMQKYTEEIISPAIRYFEMKREIEKSEDSLSNNIMGAGILLLVSFAAFTVALVEVNFLAIKWLCPVIALPICVFVFWFTLLLYRKSFQIRKCKFSLDKLKEDAMQYNKYNNKFSISESDAVNNYIIMSHYNYLYSIYDTIILRSSLSKSLFGIALAITVVLVTLCY